MRTLRVMLAAICLMAPLSHAGGAALGSGSIAAEADALFERASAAYASATSYRHTCAVEVHDGADPSSSMLAMSIAMSAGTSTMAWVRPDKLEITGEDTITRTDGVTFWVYSRVQREYSKGPRLPDTPFLQGLPMVDMKGVMGAYQVLGMLLANSEETAPALRLDGTYYHEVRAEVLEGEPGHRVIMGYPGLTIDEAASSIWFSDHTGVMGEIRVRPAMQQPPPELGAEDTEELFGSETPDRTDWPWVALGFEFSIRYRDVELNSEIAPATFIFVPGPDDRLVDQLEPRFDRPESTTPLAVEPNITREQGSTADFRADRLVTLSRHQLGSGIRAHGARVLDFDNDGRPEVLLPTLSPELVIVSPNGREAQRVFLQGEGARGTISDVELVTAGSTRFWFVAFADWSAAEPAQVGCALFTTEGEEVWRFAPEVPGDHEPELKLAVGDLDGDGQPELIAMLSVSTDDWIQKGNMTTRNQYSHVIVFDVTGRRLVQRRLQGSVWQVQVTSPASGSGRQKLLLIRRDDASLTQNVELFALEPMVSEEYDEEPSQVTTPGMPDSVFLVIE